MKCHIQNVSGFIYYFLSKPILSHTKIYQIFRLVGLQSSLFHFDYTTNKSIIALSHMTFVNHRDLYCHYDSSLQLIMINPIKPTYVFEIISFNITFPLNITEYTLLIARKCDLYYTS